MDAAPCHGSQGCPHRHRATYASVADSRGGAAGAGGQHGAAHKHRHGAGAPRQLALLGRGFLVGLPRGRLRRLAAALPHAAGRWRAVRSAVLARRAAPAPARLCQRLPRLRRPLPRSSPAPAFRVPAGPLPSEPISSCVSHAYLHSAGPSLACTARPLVRHAGCTHSGAPGKAASPGARLCTGEQACGLLRKALRLGGVALAQRVTRYAQALVGVFPVAVHAAHAPNCPAAPKARRFSTRQASVACSSGWQHASTHCCVGKADWQGSESRRALGSLPRVS